MPDQPLVSIVTPSWNMKRYLAETVQSVLAQDYPRIEYIVMDGGSTDGTLDLLADFGTRLRWVSEPDRGAADAINNGFALSTGTVLGWISADDLYAPDAVSRAMQTLTAHPEVDVVYGDGMWIDDAGQPIGPYPTRDFDAKLFGTECYICQPAAFFRRTAFEEVGGLDIALQTSYDYDLWIRLARRSRFRRIPGTLAYSRMHRSNKTIGQRSTVFRESMGLQLSNFGYVPMSWIFSYAAYLADGRDQFWEPFQPGMRKYLRSLRLGLGWNRRHPLRFFAEWLRAGPGVVMASVRAGRRPERRQS